MKSEIDFLFQSKFLKTDFISTNIFCKKSVNLIFVKLIYAFTFTYQYIFQKHSNEIIYRYFLCCLDGDI
jgi:hypothetical protein